MISATLGRSCAALGRSWDALGALMGRSWSFFGRSWAALGCSWAALYGSRPLLVRSRPLLGHSCLPFLPQRPRNNSELSTLHPPSSTLKLTKLHLIFLLFFCSVLAPSWAPFWLPLGRPFWPKFGPSRLLTPYFFKKVDFQKTLKNIRQNTLF